MALSPAASPASPRLLIVGGGLAGLSAAAALANRGMKITLLESRPRLGGRASSFTDPATGEPVDNCQHVSMACCTNLADFCRRVGTSDLFRREPAVVFLGPDGRLSRLEAGLLPAPFHLAGSFLRAQLLELLRQAPGCLRPGPAPNGAGADRAGESFAAWLLCARPDGPDNEPLLGDGARVGLERAARTDGRRPARKVFLDGFLRNRYGFQMEIPLVPLGELYGTRLETWLGAMTSRCGSRLASASSSPMPVGVALRSGERIAADFLVLAVPFDRIRGLDPTSSPRAFPGSRGWTPCVPRRSRGCISGSTVPSARWTTW